MFMSKKRFLYIITNISMPGICKVGITDDVEKRLKNLNSKTEVPARFQLYEVFDLADKAQFMEQLILEVFADKRVNMRREFLEIHPEVLCEFVKKTSVNLKKKKFKKDFLPSWVSQMVRCCILLRVERYIKISL